ncbi:hypothetical protein BGZ79_000835 [Entomortierella chlamydospora]|nr:hypothetical protein BGZ79_000835 [Entomortierella chlamydospora]
MYSSGYASVFMSRPDLHALLLSHVPSHKIHLGKRVLSLSQSSENGVLVRTSDGSTYECDILVGSDGAYSGVRQSLYSLMKKEGCLPSSDGEDMKSDAFKNSEWGSESSGSIEEDWRAFKLPLGPDNSYITIGDLINSTDSDNATKVMLEEKLYTAWHHGRVVLMGDGAVNAMLDAVILANSLYEIAKDATYSNIRSAFKEYYNERFPHAKADLESSKKVASLVSGQAWTDDIMRKVMLNFMPSSVINMTFVKTLAYRPQASFLPKIEYRGSGRVDPQKESKRYLQENAAAI